jgi:hypothetical protein
VVTVKAADRRRLAAIVANRNSPQKHTGRCMTRHRHQDDRIGVLAATP